MKRCNGCGRDLSVAEFNRNKSSRDGLQAHCRTCQLKDNIPSSRRYYERHATAVGEAVKKRNAKRPRPDPSRSGPRVNQSAHKKVERAVRSGMLVRPTLCPRCGRDDSRIEAHHEDYKRPLDVMWLCARCHKRGHFETREVA